MSAVCTINFIFRLEWNHENQTLIFKLTIYVFRKDMGDVISKKTQSYSFNSLTNRSHREKHACIKAFP